MPFKVLYIEDDPQQLEIVRMFLARDGIEVIGARDGVQGIQLARELHPDLIIFDLNLPVMTGMETAQLLRQEPEFASTPFVALTSMLRFGYEAQDASDAFNAYLAKPVTRTELNTFVRAFLIPTNP